MDNDALSTLREFVADCMALGNNNLDETLNNLETEWPDLAVTFKRAFALVEKEG